MMVDLLIGSDILDTGPGIEIDTRKGNRIPNEQGLEWDPIRLQGFQRKWTKEYPLIKPRSLTATYNCMGHVFASRRTLIDIKYLQWILEEDGFRQVGKPPEAGVGDIVVYQGPIEKAISHVGIIVDLYEFLQESLDVWVLSKWGRGGEYVHILDQVPFFLGQPVQFWTERIILD